MVPMGTSTPSICWRVSASRRARGTPPVWRPTRMTPSRPWLCSTISCAMRVTARRRSSASMTRVRATKTPPCGGAAARSRSAKRDLSVPCRPHRTGVNGVEVRLALGPDLLGDAAQHAVDEAPRLLGGVPPSQLDRLGDDSGRWHVRAPEQLVDADAQQIPVHDRHAFERPVLGEAPDQFVDLVLVLADAAH